MRVYFNWVELNCVYFNKYKCATSWPEYIKVSGTNLPQHLVWDTRSFREKTGLGSFLLLSPSKRLDVVYFQKPNVKNGESTSSQSLWLKLNTLFRNIPQQILQVGGVKSPHSWGIHHSFEDTLCTADWCRSCWSGKGETAALPFYLNHTAFWADWQDGWSPERVSELVLDGRPLRLFCRGLFITHPPCQTSCLSYSCRCRVWAPWTEPQRNALWWFLSWVV